MDNHNSNSNSYFQQPPYGYGYGTGQSQPQNSYQQYPPQGGYPPTSGYPPSTSPNPIYPQGPPPNQGQYYPQGQAYPGGPPAPHHPQQQAPPPQQPERSGWGTSPVPNPYPTSPHPPPAYQADSSPPVAPGNPRSLSDKFATLGLRHKKSHDSSSDSDSSHKKKHDKPKFDSRYGPYPFSCFCAKDNPETIVLEIVDCGAGYDRLVGPNQDVDHPAYCINYEGDDGFKAERCELPSLDPKKSEFAGKYTRKDKDPSRCHFKFPWGKWDYEIFNEWWSSDVGLLGGKSDMKWYLIEGMNTYATGAFVARCFDTTHPDVPTVASFYMKDYDYGRLELPARLIRTQEQLDEVVIVSFGTMYYLRDYVKENPDEKSVDNIRQKIKK